MVAELDPMLPSTARLFPSGRAGVFEAIAAAHEWLEQRDDVVLVGGFDSMVDDETLAHLDAEAALGLAAEEFAKYGIKPDGE